MSLRSAAGLLLAALAVAWAPPMQAEPLYACSPELPCINVTLVEKVQDLTAVTVATPVAARVYATLGDLVVNVDGRQHFRGTMAAPAIACCGPLIETHPSLDQSAGPVAVVFEESGTYQSYAVVNKATASLQPVIAEVWLAYVEVVVAPDVHYVFTLPWVVPVS